MWLSSHFCLYVHQFSLIPTAPKQGWAQRHREWLSLDSLLSLLFVKKGWGKELLCKHLASIIPEAQGSVPSITKNKSKAFRRNRTDWTLPSSQSPEERKAACADQVACTFLPRWLLCSPPFLMLPAFILFFLLPSFGSMFGLLFCFILA